MSNAADVAPGLGQVTDTLLLNTSVSPRRRAALRAMLFAYLGIVLCPIQYWPLTGEVDSTLIFALNYGHAHQLVIGRDIFWNWGPLSHLLFPMDIGGHLARGLAFQAIAWLILLSILWNLFYRSGLRLRHLVFFSVFLGLSASVSGGADQVLLRCAMILLLQYKVRQGVWRYIAALAILGLLPLINFSWAMATAGTAVGLVVYPVVSRQPVRWRNLLLAATVPLCVAGSLYWLTLGSFQVFSNYLKVSTELARGYSVAMSAPGAMTELFAALEALFLAAIAVSAVARHNRDIADFLVCVLAVPLFVSFKHGFVVQDAHIHHYFCFVALILALAALTAPLHSKRTAARFAVIALAFGLIWQDNVARAGPDFALTSTGLKTALHLRNLLRHVSLRQADAQTAFLPDQIVEEEIKSIVQHEPIASLSTLYNHLYAGGMNLALYPIVQRYSAYTPYLDQLNATWIREHGPRFLVFDGKANGRHPWTETPAMWLEVYRWYDTRLLAVHNLLLERRAQPRFTRLERVERAQMRLGEEFTVSTSSQPVFWSMDCALSRTGEARALFFRVPPTTMTVHSRGGGVDVFRVPLAVLRSPSPGGSLPSNLAEFAAVFRGESGNVEKLSFGGPGSSAYNPTCSVEFLRPQ